MKKSFCYEKIINDVIDCFPIMPQSYTTAGITSCGQLPHNKKVLGSNLPVDCGLSVSDLHVWFSSRCSDFLPQLKDIQFSSTCYSKWV